MAVPKKRKSYSRTRKRRTHKKLEAVLHAFCSNCGAEKHAHNVCESCGFYNGRQIIQTKKDKKFVTNTSNFVK